MRMQGLGARGLSSRHTRVGRRNWEVVAFLRFIVWHRCISMTTKAVVAIASVWLSIS